jgi:hypothetical protein
VPKYGKKITQYLRESVLPFLENDMGDGLESNGTITGGHVLPVYVNVR